MTALVDTGFLLATLARNDPRHEACKAVMQSESNPLIPSSVLPELAYMIVRDMGYSVLVQFMQTVTGPRSPIVFVEMKDLLRTTELVNQYADSRIDFVDCTIVAVSERLNITRIFTIDQRHFRLLRPKHCDYFDISYSAHPAEPLQTRTQNSRARQSPPLPLRPPAVAIEQ